MTKKLYFPRFTTALACLFALLFVGNAFGQTNNYFGASGTISGNVWSTNVGGPFNSAFNTTSGGIMNFNSTVTAFTGANIPVAGINATASTATMTAGGTISNLSNGVITINVGTSVGTTLDFGSQAFATGGGYAKSGVGALAFSGSAYTGGFTLNAGTIILRVTSSLGSGAVNFNGGTIAANADRSITAPTSITIGGDLQLGEIPANVSLASNTANISFSDAVSLGTSIRTLTLGNAGTHTFSGVISGSG